MNTLAKHTPGPWYVHPTEEPTAITAGDYYVATAHAIGWTGDHVANALLIAAAPEMAMAAISAREMLGEMLRTAASNDQADAIDEVSSALSAALRKAGLLS